MRMLARPPVAVTPVLHRGDSWKQALKLPNLREGVKYYFADFVRKGGEGGTPQIRNLFFGPKSGVFEQKNTIFSPF